MPLYTQLPLPSSKPIRPPPQARASPPQAAPPAPPPTCPAYFPWSRGVWEEGGTTDQGALPAPTPTRDESLSSHPPPSFPSAPGGLSSPVGQLHSEFSFLPFFGLFPRGEAGLDWGGEGGGEEVVVVVRESRSCGSRQDGLRGHPMSSDRGPPPEHGSGALGLRGSGCRAVGFLRGGVGERKRKATPREGGVGRAEARAVCSRWCALLPTPYGEHPAWVFVDGLGTLGRGAEMHSERLATYSLAMG